MHTAFASYHRRNSWRLVCCYRRGSHPLSILSCPTYRHQCSRGLLTARGKSKQSYPLPTPTAAISLGSKAWQYRATAVLWLWAKDRRTATTSIAPVCTAKPLLSLPARLPTSSPLHAVDAGCHMAPPRLRDVMYARQAWCAHSVKTTTPGTPTLGAHVHR